jgi:hypothetical protein
MWKRNVLNAMRNGWDERYRPALEIACGDTDARVRARAAELRARVGRG